MGFPVVWLAAALALGPPKYHRGHSQRPYHANWGPYQVIVEKADKEDEQERVRILNKKGRLLREIDDHAIIRVDTVELTGKPPAELHISTWTGGAYCCFTDVYFTCEGNLRNILIFKGEDLGVRGIKDINHDGIPKIITDNPVLGDFSGYNFHRHWPLVTILSWDGKRCVDVTRRYPQRSLRQARLRRQYVLALLNKSSQYRRDWEFEDEITAYYANMLAVGRGAEARRWLSERLPKSTLKWLWRHDKELRRIVAEAAKRRALASQDKIIHINQFGIQAARD